MIKDFLGTPSLFHQNLYCWKINEFSCLKDPWGTTELKIEDDKIEFSRNKVGKNETKAEENAFVKILRKLFCFITKNFYKEIQARQPKKDESLN